ncbi:hypothetical protein TNCV_1026141 [Trichonephila clavipes]|nr:hypothetical protein TNCV_1026141 [Trichonephila clavipes]
MVPRFSIGLKSGEFAGPRRTNVIHRKTLPVVIQWTFSFSTGVQIPAYVADEQQSASVHEPSVYFGGQTQQRSLNSSLGYTVGGFLVRLRGQLLNGSTSICPNASPQPSFTSMIYGHPSTTFATSLILDSPILPLPVYFYHGGTRTVHKFSFFGIASTLGLKANDHAVLDIG